MNEDIQLQIFNRSFSTKAADRGLGTYSMKILTEKYLKGKIYFTSKPETGTSFIIEIPGQG
jgi:sensor histidine kinase regulating citrate/malate metabolism